jgi:hypothetical protein
MNWNNFWYSHPPTYKFGGGPGRKIFRSQRLFNVIVLIVLLLIILFK